jgi:TP901 family phage tail tape measure protein
MTQQKLGIEVGMRTNIPEQMKQIAVATNNVNTALKAQITTVSQANAAFKALEAGALKMTTGQQNLYHMFPKGTRAIETQQTVLDNFGVINQKTADKIKDTGTVSQDASQKVKGLGASVLVSMIAMRAIMTIFTSIKKAVMDSAKAFREFELRMAEVSTIVRNTEKHMTGLEMGVRALSKAYGKSASDLSRGLYDILSAAVPVEDSLNLLNIAAKAATAGLTNVETSVSVLTSVMNAYGYTTAQMAQKSDVMFQAVIRGKFRYEDLASALGYVTPIAAQAGITFEEVAAAISSATRQGQHVDTVARGLALTIQNIIKPSNQASKAAQELGIDLSIAAIQAHGLEGFLQRVAEATNNNAAQISQLIPNMRSYRVAMVLASKGADEFSTDLDLMENSLGATDTAFSKIADTVDMNLDVLEQFKEEMLRVTGESTQAVERLSVTWDAFWANVTKRVMTMGEMKKNPLENLLMLAPGAGLIGGALLDTKRQTDEAQKQVDEFIKDRADRLAHPEKYEEKSPLFSLIQEEGMEALDLSEFDRLNKRIEEGVKRAENLSKALSYAREVDSPSWAIEGIIEEFTTVSDRIISTREELNYFTAAIDDAGTYVEETSKKIDDISAHMKDLKSEISDATQKLKEMEAQKPIAEMSHWLSNAIAEQTYQVELAEQGYEWYTDAMDAAVTTIRDYEKAQKDATEAQKEFNFTLAENRLETMKIQLLGMMRRRGNTREEQRLLKQLNIERTELQIQAAEDEIEIHKDALEEKGDSEREAYEKAISLLEKEQRAREHHLWMIKDTREEDISDLNSTIEFKKSLYDEYSGIVVNKYDEMNGAMEIRLNLIKEMYGEEGEEVQNLIDFYEQLDQTSRGSISDAGVNLKVEAAKSTVKDVQDAISTRDFRSIPNILTNWTKRAKSYSRETSYIPSDGLYHLHRGESVGRGSAGDNITVNVSVTGNTISKESEVDIADKIGEAVSQKLVDRKSGKSKYRMR